MSVYPQQAKRILRKLPFNYDNAFVAGGALTSVFTNQPINDLDVFFRTEEDFKNACLQSVDDGLFVLDVSERAVTFNNNGGPTVQLCRTVFGEPVDIFDSFDFTICMGAVDIGAESCVFHDDFLIHNAQRFLHFNPKTKYPIASMLRVIKFQQKGYTIGKGHLLKILLASRRVELNSWEQFANQIGGAYGRAVLLDIAGTPFSIDAALEVLSNDLVFDKFTPTVPEKKWNEDYGDTLIKALGYAVPEVRP